MGYLVTGMQCFLPGPQQFPVAIAGLCPQAKHFQRKRCPRVLQEALLAAMAWTAGKAVASSQQLAGLMAQAMSQVEMGAVGSQKVSGRLHDLVDRK